MSSDRLRFWFWWSVGGREVELMSGWANGLAAAPPSKTSRAEDLS
jgi:hypothetical protein